VSRYQKGKTNQVLLKQETVSGSGISWAICKSALRSRQITTPPSHGSVFYSPDALPAPNQQCQSTEGDVCKNKHYLIHKQKVVYIGNIKKSHDPLHTTAATKESCRGKMLYMISSRSVTDGVSLLVSKSKLVYSSLIFHDN